MRLNRCGHPDSVVDQQMVRIITGCGVLAVLALGVLGCSSTGSLGIVTKTSATPAAFIESEGEYEELGLKEGRACRHFVLAIIPFGNSDVQAAVDKALENTGGDALINVSTVTSLYGFVPIYNVYSFTCTTVRGTVIKMRPFRGDSQEPLT